jgi:hypothetical protein
MPGPTMRLTNASIAAIRQAVAIELHQITRPGEGERWYVLAESPAGIRQQLHTATDVALYRSLEHAKRTVQRLAPPAVILQIFRAQHGPTPPKETAPQATHAAAR